MLNSLIKKRLLKKGGQKEVYTAEHPDYGKVVFKKIFSTSDSFERTKREVKAVSLLNSEYIPKIFAHNCEHKNPQFIWILEEYIAGNDLRTVLSTGRIFSIKEIVHFLEIMLKIAVESEKNRLVHRDIKPDNIILDTEGDFWLLDFGIVRHLDLKSITETNSPYGVFTLGYASSEQFRNIKNEIDIRADLFSIGVVCYEMLKGINYYVHETNNDVFRIIKKLENNSVPPLRIKGDNQYQLSTFISLLGDHRRNRRPKTARQAMLIFETLKSTLTLN